MEMVDGWRNEVKRGVKEGLRQGEREMRNRRREKERGDKWTEELNERAAYI